MDLNGVLRSAAPRVLAVVLRRFRDFAAAEDAVQEALAAAALQWPRSGVPEHPVGWLVQVASRRMMDQVRADSARRAREGSVHSELSPDEPFDPGPELALPSGDDSLALLFMCCHPALTAPSAIALTLRAVGGLSTAEIAHAFLVPEPTMAQRISRAKETVRASGVPFALPSADERPERLARVLHVLYLIFNEGYVASGGADLVRGDLANEAIRLMRGVSSLLGDEPEVAGLLALMLLTDARRAARTGPGGEPIPLDRQDRSRWDRSEIEEGVALLSRTLPLGRPGPYQLQAAVAAVHDEAPRMQDTDWRQILALYEVLLGMGDNPMVGLSHAVALAMVRGPAEGLARVDALAKDKRLTGHHRLEAVRAHLLEMTGDRAAAARHYLRAAAKTNSVPERDYLIAQAARLEAEAL